MATYTITAIPSGSTKNNAATRSISSVFQYDADQYKTISELTRKYGIWCNCGGKYQSVTLSGYDQLVNSSTGAVIKTSSTGESTCHGTGPAAENYMTCTFSNWTRSESNAAVAAWKAGALKITRTVSVKSYTSNNHGTPYERNGFYDDTITITGSTLPFTDYRPQIETFSCMRSSDGVTESQLSTSVYAKIRLRMNDSSGLYDSPRLTLRYSSDASFQSATTVTLGTSSSAISPYMTLTTVKVNGTFSAGSNYYFQLIFSAGEESATYSGVSVSMSYTPIHIPQNNSGVALGMYSNASSADKRFECNYPAYFYGGIAQIGSGGGLSPDAFGIQVGKVEIQSIASGNKIQLDVTFDRAYSTTPTVIVGLTTSKYSSPLGRCSTALMSAETSKFTAMIANYSDSGMDLGLSWVAFGTLA